MFKQFNQETIYLVTMPFVVAFIVLEIYLSFKDRSENYTKKDTFTNICFALLNFSLDMIMKGFSFFCSRFFLYSQVFYIRNWINLLVFVFFVSRFFILYSSF